MGPPSKEYQIWSTHTISILTLWICKGKAHFLLNVLQCFIQTAKLLTSPLFVDAWETNTSLGNLLATGGKPPYPWQKVSIGIARLDTSGFYIPSSNVISAGSCSRQAWWQQAGFVRSLALLEAWRCRYLSAGCCQGSHLHCRASCSQGLCTTGKQHEAVRSDQVRSDHQKINLPC